MATKRPILEDIYDVAAPDVAPEVGGFGQVTGWDTPVEELLILGKYLILAMSENEKARELATDHEIVFTDDEVGLTIHGHPESCLEFMLACWAEPSVRRIFTSLGLFVVGGEGIPKYISKGDAHE